MKHFDFHRECVTRGRAQSQGDYGSARMTAAGIQSSSFVLSGLVEQPALPADVRADRALAYSLRVRCADPSRRQLLPAAHALAYNAGRILTYTLLGALAGAAGGGIGHARTAGGTGIRRAHLSPAPHDRRRASSCSASARKQLVQIRSRGIAARSREPSAGCICRAPRGKFGLGLTLGFLPCGLIYAALLKAMDPAAPLAGALTMLAFGLGTAVALLAMGVASSFAGCAWAAGAIALARRLA